MPNDDPAFHRVIITLLGKMTPLSSLPAAQETQDHPAGDWSEILG
jgi:hypothetical protein